MKIAKLKPLLSVFGASLLLVAAFFIIKNNQAENVEAQSPGDGEWTCSVVVPEGLPLRRSSEIINGVYEEYQEASDNLDAAIKLGQLTVAALKEPCDFTKCVAESENIAPDFIFGVKPLLFMDFLKFDGLALRPPICAQKECVGDPCSMEVLNKTIDELKTEQKALKGNYENIRAIFTEKTEDLTYDLAESQKEINAGTKLTKKEYVERSMEWAEEELKSCGLTQAERELASQGKFQDRTELLCLEALNLGYYQRPKPWSENCGAECSSGLNEECVSCLKKCQGDSFLAKLNCEMYRLPDENPVCGANEICCGKVCSSGFGPACENCLCAGLSQEECLRKVCAGSTENFVCCYK